MVKKNLVIFARISLLIVFFCAIVSTQVSAVCNPPCGAGMRCDTECRFTKDPDLTECTYTCVDTCVQTGKSCSQSWECCEGSCEAGKCATAASKCTSDSDCYADRPRCCDPGATSGHCEKCCNNDQCSNKCTYCDTTPNVGIWECEDYFNQDPRNKCPICRVCDGAGACTYAESGTDPMNECFAGSWSCVGNTPNVCSRRAASGLCDGEGSCGYTYQVVAGAKVCIGGVAADPTTVRYCDTYTTSCTAGTCSDTVTTYYHGCTINNCDLKTGSCDCVTGANSPTTTTQTYTAAAGETLTAACVSNTANLCNDVYACSSGNGGVYGAGGRYRCQARCDGSGHCLYAVNCQDCGGGTCTDSGDDWNKKEFITVDAGCASGLCVTDQTFYDYCEAGGTQVVHDRDCSGGSQAADLVYDCDHGDNNNLQCVYQGSFLNMSGDDWQCNDGACYDTGSRWTSLIACDATRQCTTQLCSGTNYVCYRTNAGTWTWGVSAESSETACADSYNNDCDAYWDYDTMQRSPSLQASAHGDNNCPVEITGITVNDTTLKPNSPLTITCTANTNAQVNSVFAYIDENNDGNYDSGIDNDCGWGAGDSWIDNNHVRFTNCNSGSIGVKRAACGAYNSATEPYNKSYQYQPDQTMAIVVCTQDEETMCTDDIDNDCDLIIDGRDSTNCKEGHGMPRSINRGCDDAGDNDGDSLIDLDDDGCCDLCISAGYHFDTTYQSQCGTLDCYCGTEKFKWENTAQQEEYCCGDDANEFYKINPSNASVTACCNESAHCVDINGDCQIGTEELFGLCTNEVDDDCDGNIDINDTNCTGTLTGYVYKQGGTNPVAGATVRGSLPGTPYESQAVTGPDGSYTINNALVGEYAFIASKPGYDDNVIIIAIESKATQTQDFSLRNGSCHYDCTDYYGNCNPDCQGLDFGAGETCTFISTICYNRPKGFVASYKDADQKITHEYTCCEGPERTYSTVKATVTGDVENVYDYKFTVLVGGQRRTLHILYWNN